MRPGPLPPIAQAILDPTKPFTSRTLSVIRSRLAEAETARAKDVDPRKARLKPRGHGAVLAPLLNVDNRSVGVLIRPTQQNGR